MIDSLGTVGMAQHAQRRKTAKELTAYVCSGVGTVATNQEQGNDGGTRTEPSEQNARIRW
jgi:hypothetical protein